MLIVVDNNSSGSWWRRLIIKENDNETVCGDNNKYQWLRYIVVIIDILELVGVVIINV